MKGIVVTTDGFVEVRDFDEPLYQTVGKAVGGWIEIAAAEHLREPFRLIVNEEGLLRGLPINPTGTLLRGRDSLRSPIVGDLVIMKIGMTEEGPDIVGLDENDCEELMATLPRHWKGVSKR